MPATSVSAATLSTIGIAHGIARTPQRSPLSVLGRHRDDARNAHYPRHVVHTRPRVAWAPNQEANRGAPQTPPRVERRLHPSNACMLSAGESTDVAVQVDETGAHDKSGRIIALGAAQGPVPTAAIWPSHRHIADGVPSLWPDPTPAASYYQASPVATPH